MFKEASTDGPHIYAAPEIYNTPSPRAVKQSVDFPNEEKDRHVIAKPGTVIGALIGSAIAYNKVQNQKILNSVPISPPMEKKPKVQKHPGYVDQMNNIVNNLRVIFTPVSVIYVVKNGTSELTLDTIERNEMNEDMLLAWRNKDQIYYKNLFLNKMQTDIQLAEQEFMKRVINKQMELQKGVNKTAGVSEVDVDDLTTPELFCYASTVKNFFERDTDITNKVASVITNDIDDGVEYIISETRLDRPFDKYAGVVGDALNAIGFNSSSKDLDSLQKKYLNPNYIKKKVKVGFMPDRVIFVVDDKIVNTLNVLSMNEEGFEHFQKKDKDFFKKYFERDVKLGIARLNENKMTNISFEKKAEEQLDTENIFIKNNVNPIVYFLLLIKKYGYQWVDFDSHALIKAVEKDFLLSRPIADIPINKIMSAKVANNGNTVYTSRHAFEKVIRSFNNKPIDFLTREVEDLELKDFVFGLDILNRVTPYDNIYDNFSPEVYDYIVKALADKETYVWGVNVTGTEEEFQFMTILNYSLLSELNSRFTALIDDPEQKNDIIKDNETIFDTSLLLIDMVNTQKKKNENINIKELINAYLLRTDIKKDLYEIITRQVMINVSLDNDLNLKEQELLKQLSDLNLLENNNA